MNPNLWMVLRTVISLCLRGVWNLPGFPCAIVLSIDGLGVQFASNDIIIIPGVLVDLHTDSNDLTISFMASPTFWWII